jgi:K+-sensing histidine kinase KdpD
MKIFIYKLALITIVLIIAFKMTIGSLISSFENKITKYNNKGERNKIINKIRKEIQTANNKDRILTEIDSELISTLLSKIKNELNQK